MSTPTFADTPNLVAFLEKPAKSAGFEKIIDFLKSKSIHYALTMNLTIYVSYVKQFWATVKVNKDNDQEQIQALVDKTKVIITEDDIRSDLRLDDAEGTACLLNEAIFKGLACMSNLKKCLSDEPLAIPLDELHIDDKLRFVEEPVEIMDREIKRLRQSHIPIIKFRWNSKRGPEFTWEREDQFKHKYPHLFTNRASSSTTRS
nr:putative reverse transcriptase domain-containing protein [Tanacetum cinerariifolium]